MFESRSAFQVPFQVHKNKLSSLHLQYAVANGLERSLDIQILLKCLLKCCVYVSSITVKFLESYHYSDTMIKYVPVVRMMTNTVMLVLA